MSRDVLLDTSAIVALLDADDANHASAVQLAESLMSRASSPFLTNYVEVETHALLLRRLGRAAARAWLLEEGIPVVRAAPRHEQRAREIIARFDDKDWSLCDAISFAVMESRGTRTAFSFDHHFQQYGRFEVLGL